MFDTKFEYFLQDSWKVRIDDDTFGEPKGKEIGGGVFFPMAGVRATLAALMIFCFSVSCALGALLGYVSDPMLAARNLQTASEALIKSLRRRKLQVCTESSD